MTELEKFWDFFSNDVHINVVGGDTITGEIVSKSERTVVVRRDNGDLAGVFVAQIVHVAPYKRQEPIRGRVHVTP